ncbi:MAG: GNAT family N-acetyltransferase [Gammaproteobacteria bacterium]|nr:GNAT family N-acetyltransferase [Gammaproteobacteria bacterium]NNC98000.1 GNAT family N-acetyltransferase [Gammaproteobacteria bacterium]NNM13825.1 GNAT family N-acetyltransferase [Gammaproteobacteria bacterium]
MSIKILQLNQSSVALLDNLAQEVFDHAIQSEYLSAFINDPRHVMFLAIDQETVVGMASAVEYFHPDKPAQLWINEVGVAPSHRRQSIGRRLVQALIAEAEKRGCVYAWLGTDENNLSGKMCFGSVPDGEDPQNFLLYEWELD